MVGYKDSQYYGKTFYYKRHSNEKWNKNFVGKVSLMYLHDYDFSISDTANCQEQEDNYADCQTGWMHLSQNDTSSQLKNEWTMSRQGWNPWDGLMQGNYIKAEGFISRWKLDSSYSIRPVFYINASEKLLGGIGTLEDPFIIAN